MLKFTTRIHEAASTDEARPVLTHVRVKDGFAYATDSYVLAKAPVISDGEDDLVPAEAVKKAWVSTGREPSSWAILHDNGAWNVVTPKQTTVFPNGLKPTDVHYPNCDDLLNGAIDRVEHADGSITIGLDVEKLLRAARAINGEKHAHVRLTVDPACTGTKARPMVVRPFDLKSEAVAIVMPMKVG